MVNIVDIRSPFQQIINQILLLQQRPQHFCPKRDNLLEHTCLVLPHTLPASFLPQNLLPSEEGSPLLPASSCPPFPTHISSKVGNLIFSYPVPRFQYVYTSEQRTAISFFATTELSLFNIMVVHLQCHNDIESTIQNNKLKALTTLADG